MLYKDSLIVGLSFLLFSSGLNAGDFFPPAYRGEPLTTTQQWSGLAFGGDATVNASLHTTVSSPGFTLNTLPPVPTLSLAGMTFEAKIPNWFPSPITGDPLQTKMRIQFTLSDPFTDIFLAINFPALTVTENGGNEFSVVGSGRDPFDPSALNKWYVDLERSGSAPFLETISFFMPIPSLLSDLVVDTKVIVAPEPSTYVLFALALGVVCKRRRSLSVDR